MSLESVLLGVLLLVLVGLRIPFKQFFKEIPMSLGTILLIVLILMLVGAIPSWGHSKSWGYGPSGGLGLVVIIVFCCW